MLFTLSVSIFSLIAGAIGNVDDYVGCQRKFKGMFKYWNSIDNIMIDIDKTLCSNDCLCYISPYTKSLYHTDSVYRSIFDDTVKGDENETIVNIKQCSKSIKNQMENEIEKKAYENEIKDFNLNKFATYWKYIEEKFECNGFCSTIYEDNDKSATNKLHIGAKLNLKGFIKTCIDFTIEKTKVETVKVDDVGGSSGYFAKIGSSGDYAKIGSSGYSAKIGSSGYSAQIGSSGYSAKIGSSGYSAQIGSSGDYAQIGSSGDYAKIGSSGDSAKIGSSGDYAQIGSSGDSAKIGSSGDSAKIVSEGKNSVVMAAGYNSIAKAKVGSWITLAEWVQTNERYKNGNLIWIPKLVKTEYVDGERIKEDTFYKLKNGEFKEV